MGTHWHREADAEGVTWLHLDVAGAGPNVLSSAVFDELDELLAEIATAVPKSVAFVSDKAGFIAGADVKEFQTIRTREDALAIVQRGQEVINRVEALPCPTVAVINGYCLGGGLELALACDYRIALDDPKVRLGLPEIKLGIHPGFGGSVRTIRLLGPLAAMELMLTGKTLDARQAQKIGLIDQVVPARYLLDAARQRITTRLTRHAPGRFARALNSKPARPLLARQMRRRVATKAKPQHYPAPYALIDLWRRYADDERIMLKQEAESVANLSLTDTARNLVRMFMLQNRLKACGDKGNFQSRHVHIIGAGTMGRDIAAWIVLQGLRVTVQDERIESLAETVQHAAKLFVSRLRSERQIASAMDRLIPDQKGLGLRHANVIIEAIFENLEAKQALFRAIEPHMKSDALLATNTSSLPIERLAAGLNDPGRLVGLHFFNPVAQMPLIEVVRSTHSHDAMVAAALGFVRRIDKLPLETKSSPGFLVNRVLAPYLLEAIKMVDDGIPISVIDQAIKDFGMLMGPLEMADIVGLDIALSVGEILSREYGYVVPEKLRAMVAEGRLGRKSGQGFYAYKDGAPVRDKKVSYASNSQALQSRLIQRLINEALACLRDGVVRDADLVDAGVVFGAGFAPFRGGPLHYRSTLRLGSTPAQAIQPQ
ncbi:MAG TPA: 3-hydroxyacyl-CoA dehydrogenase NAD-binding domain-containing protein [Gammaproteobacteria bacterium]|nr:3-hydroxyacyl-CoA dehydrogenase NAD-binding domain-containing protein [Gammaproteobacteria bacterium]